MSLFLIVAMPFIGALLPGLMVRAGRRSAALTTLAVTATALIGLCTHIPAVARGEVIRGGVDWLPGLGLNAHFFLDGLGLLFAGLILGIGVLIIIYARYYLTREDPVGRFYAFLLLFQGAMVGIVLSDNVLMLVIFWELTSLSSFLLIGYWSHLSEGRQGARMALAVTGMGGLALIGGMLILGQIAGSYNLSDILQQREAIQDHALYLPALILILLGCFTKSAQFPFHFWLPHAMAAPTPVSAYLHSATMVKAGLFLMARLWPVLSGTEAWFYLVGTIGLVTMVIAALIAIFKDDLKGLLAFSTVSHLGLITMLLGFGTPMAAVAAVFHIINHATFKCALFMTAGIIDHEAHTRDIKRLGGLRRLMPVTFVIALLAGFSMAGLPLLNGFLSKELMLEEAVHTDWLGVPFLLPALATLGALFSAAYSFRYVTHVFFGPVRDDYPARPHDPQVGMWAPAAILVCLVVVIGVLPATAEPLVRIASHAVVGGDLPEFHLQIWHGLKPPLFLSAIATVGGILLLWRFRPLERAWQRSGPVHAKALFDALILRLVAGGRLISDGLHNGSLTRYATILLVSVIGLGAIAWFGGQIGLPTGSYARPAVVPIVAWFLLLSASILLAGFHGNRLVALVLMAIIGLVVSVGFNYLSAPDLALTQISVEVVTIILLLLALYFLPDTTPRESSRTKRIGDAAIASLAGLGVAGLSHGLMMRDFAFDSISQYHLENSYKGGGGTNVVNVILVDFRGFDTFGEIIVLGIAALVIFAATEALLDGPVRRKLMNRTIRHDRSGDPHPTMMVVNTRVMMPLILMVGVYIFLRGHNEPGGGFISGLIVAIAVIIQYMASGYAWAAERQRYPYHGIIGAGVLTAGLTGIGAWFAGRPFLSSTFGYVHLPPLEEFELASAMAFDLGVFLVVVGAVLLSLESFSRLAWRSVDTVSDHAMTIDPSRDEEQEKEEA